MKKLLCVFLATVFCLVLLPLGGRAPTAETAPSGIATEEASVGVLYTGSATRALTVGDIPLADYRIVIPEKADAEVSAAARNLRDYLAANEGIVPEIVTDAEEASPAEFLLGDTNRPASRNNIRLYEGEYLLYAVGSAIVMQGHTYMIGGAVSTFVHHCIPGTGTAVTGIPDSPKAETFVFPETATGALLLIGDGMGYRHIDAAVTEGVLDRFVAYDLPDIGQSVTRSHSVITGATQYTDSAAAATAMATGFKTLNGYLGVDPDLNSLQNVRELAFSTGAKTAVLTTDYITGATPAGFLVHCGSRESTAEIQSQITELLTAGKVTYAVGSVGNALVDEAAHELYSMTSDGSRFFAMIEEAEIDKKSHGNDLNATLARVERFNRLIAYCIQFTLLHPDTALIITADHETGGLTFDARNGTYHYTTTKHTNADVPVFALGPGTELFRATRNENVQIAKFIAGLFGDDAFGTTEVYGE